MKNCSDAGLGRQ